MEFDELLKKVKDYCLMVDDYVEKKLTYIGEIQFYQNSLSPLYKYGIEYFVYDIKYDDITPLGHHLMSIYLRCGLEENSKIKGREEMKVLVLDRLKESIYFNNIRIQTERYLEFLKTNPHILDERMRNTQTGKQDKLNYLKAIKSLMQIYLQ